MTKKFLYYVLIITTTITISKWDFFFYYPNGHTQNSSTAGFALGVDQNKPVPCTSSAASCVASTEPPLSKQHVVDIMRQDNIASWNTQL